MSWDVILVELAVAWSVLFWLWLFGWNLKHRCAWKVIAVATGVHAANDKASVTSIALQCRKCGYVVNEVISGTFTLEQLQTPERVSDVAWLRELKVKA